MLNSRTPAVGNEPFAVLLPDVLIDDYESDHAGDGETL